jgi:hypothetical protein
MSSTRGTLAIGVFLAVCASSLSAAPVCDPDNGGITLPQGFCALVAADGLGTARHLAVAPNGDVFVALQGQGEMGGVMALRDTNGDGKFEVKEHFGKAALRESRCATDISTWRASIRFCDTR